MFLKDVRGLKVPDSPSNEKVCAEHASSPMQTAFDDQIITDCQVLVCRVDSLFNNIEQAANAQGGEQTHIQASLCEADDQILDLIDRIVVTRAATGNGVRSKHAAANCLLSLDWYGEPSPYRDALLLSFVRDAARLHYPTVPNGRMLADNELEAATTVVGRSMTCVALIKELAAGFAQKDQLSAQGQTDQDGLDAMILILKEQNRIALAALIRTPAFTASAIHAKRLVLRRMLETDDSDAHHLRVELARSYFSDLNTFIRTVSQEQEPASARGSIWDTLSSRLRWLATTVHLS